MYGLNTVSCLINQIQRFIFLHFLKKIGPCGEQQSGSFIYQEWHCLWTCWAAKFFRGKGSKHLNAIRVFHRPEICLIANSAHKIHCLYIIAKPPSTLIACPVMKEAASEHRNSTTAATSSGVPTRPCGLVGVIDGSYSSWISPGHTALIRTLCAANSRAASRVKPMIPALLAT